MGRRTHVELDVFFVSIFDDLFDVNLPPAQQVTQIEDLLDRDGWSPCPVRAAEISVRPWVDTLRQVGWSLRVSRSGFAWPNAIDPSLCCWILGSRVIKHSMRATRSPDFPADRSTCVASSRERLSSQTTSNARQSWPGPPASSCFPSPEGSLTARSIAWRSGWGLGRTRRSRGRARPSRGCENSARMVRIADGGRPMRLCDGRARILSGPALAAGQIGAGVAVAEHDSPGDGSDEHCCSYLRFKRGGHRRWSV
jgi:hypothetical protein